MDKRQKILIVDDSKFNRDILKEILGEKYNYLEAENGNQAIQMIGACFCQRETAGGCFVCGRGRWESLQPFSMPAC